MLPSVIDDIANESSCVEQDLYDTEEKTFCFSEILLYTFFYIGCHRNQNMSTISDEGYI